MDCFLSWSYSPVSQGVSWPVWEDDLSLVMYVCWTILNHSYYCSRLQLTVSTCCCN